MTSIGYDAFAHCRGLTSATIHNSVTYIGYNAFEYCDDNLTIYDYVGSYGETYANENGFTFVDLTKEKGNINGNGQIDILDLAMLKQYLMSASDLSNDSFKAADIDSDGKVNVFDFIRVKQILLNK